MFQLFITGLRDIEGLQCLHLQGQAIHVLYSLTLKTNYSPLKRQYLLLDRTQYLRRLEVLNTNTVKTSNLVSMIFI
jgi:hypothetical protein